MLLFERMDPEHPKSMPRSAEQGELIRVRGRKRSDARRQCVVLSRRHRAAISVGPRPLQGRISLPSLRVLRRENDPTNHKGHLNLLPCRNPRFTSALEKAPLRTDRHLAIVGLTQPASESIGRSRSSGAIPSPAHSPPSMTKLSKYQQKLSQRARGSRCPPGLRSSQLTPASSRFSPPAHRSTGPPN